MGHQCEQSQKSVLRESMDASTVSFMDALSLGNCKPITHYTPVCHNNNEQPNLAVEEFYVKMENVVKKQLGHQLNSDFDYEPLHKLLKYHLNNVGDPFLEGSYGLNSREFEIGVLNWFANLWGLKEDKYWGYVTSGGTEGNMQGLYVGRQLHPENAILYASKEAHYSIFKIARLLRMTLITVDTLSNGAIDCDHLHTLLSNNKGRHAIINLTLGTTFKGAIDDLDQVVACLDDIGYKREEYYIHCDGALAGIMLPFIKNAPMLNFERYPIGSISLSGHKFIGSPIPCGVVITRREHYEALVKSNEDLHQIDVLANKDTTILGSRSGLTPIILWYALSKRTAKGLEDDVKVCIENAKYLKDQLALKNGIDAMLNDHSCAVVFPKPKDLAFISKWQLSCIGDLAHVFVLKNVTKEVIDQFVEELEAP